jgi:hypothetical protein
VSSAIFRYDPIGGTVDKEILCLYHLKIIHAISFHPARRELCVPAALFQPQLPKIPFGRFYDDFRTIFLYDRHDFVDRLCCGISLAVAVTVVI